MKALTSIICAVFPLMLSAQWSNISREEFGNVIKEMDKKMNEKRSYSYTAKQCFFESADSKDTVTTMNFSYHFVSELNILNIRQFNTFLVQDALVSVRIDSMERILIIENPNQDLAHLNPNRNFSDFLNSGATVQKNSSGKETVYKVKFDTLALFSNLKIWVNSNGDITKYTLISGRPVPDANAAEQRFLYPRLDVSISNIRNGNEVTQNGLIAPIFFFTDNSYSKLKEEFSDFEVLDTRANKEQK